jgi:hypothetical protein
MKDRINEGEFNFASARDSSAPVNNMAEADDDEFSARQEDLKAIAELAEKAIDDINVVGGSSDDVSDLLQQILDIATANADPDLPQDPFSDIGAEIEEAIAAFEEGYEEEAKEMLHHIIVDAVGEASYEHTDAYEDYEDDDEDDDEEFVDEDE